MSRQGFRDLEVIKAVEVKRSLIDVAKHTVLNPVIEISLTGEGHMRVVATLHRYSLGRCETVLQTERQMSRPTDTDFNTILLGIVLRLGIMYEEMNGAQAVLEGFGI